MNKLRIMMVLCLLLLGASMALAQDTSQAAADNSVVITWPPPVSEVWGSGSILGTAAVPGMAYYYLEYINLNDDLTIPENAPWLPATVGITQPVVNGTLASVDTSTVPDGVYALRLTVNTMDGLSYHNVVAPVRVNNARFNALLAGTGQEQTPEPQPTQAPQDKTPHVVPNAQYGSINIRRCDMVDNDRCPIIAALRSDDSGLVQALSSNNSGWFQVQTPSGVVGWVSPTVVTQQGDFSGLGRTQPPTPFAAPAVVQAPANTTASNVLPNGLAIDGSPTCNRSFNVQINVGNAGSAPAPAGTVTLQDVNIRTGEILFTGYGNYAALNPGDNFVVVISAKVSVYYNEDHELRAYANGRQFNKRYSLKAGDCNQSSHSSDNNDNNQQTDRTLRPGKCTIQAKDQVEAYDRPNGEVAVILDPGNYPAVEVKKVGGLTWYQITFADAGTWVTSNVVSKKGDCSLN